MQKYFLTIFFIVTSKLRFYLPDYILEKVFMAELELNCISNESNNTLESKIVNSFPEYMVLHVYNRFPNEASKALRN